MTIEMTEDKHFHLVCFLPLEEGKVDFMGAVWTEENGEVHTKFRLRYYNSDCPWDEEDIKRWCAIKKEPGTEATALEEFKRLVSALEEKCGNTADVIVVDGDGVAAMEAMKQRAWCFVREEKVDEDLPSGGRDLSDREVQAGDDWPPAGMDEEGFVSDKKLDDDQI